MHVRHPSMLVSRHKRAQDKLDGEVTWGRGPLSHLNLSRSKRQLTSYEKS